MGIALLTATCFGLIAALGWVEWRRRRGRETVAMERAFRAARTITTESRVLGSRFSRVALGARRLRAAASAQKQIVDASRPPLRPFPRALLERAGGHRRRGEALRRLRQIAETLEATAAELARFRVGLSRAGDLDIALQCLAVEVETATHDPEPRRVA
jgi:hypothetical protein